MFPRLYENVTCPLAGYEGWTLRILLNPTGAEKEDWAFGHLGLPSCEACQKLGTQRGKSKTGESQARVYCTDCQAARERFGRAAVAIFGESQAKGLDFSSADAALQSFEQPELPDEFVAWLYWAPGALWGARTEELKKKLHSPSPNGS